MWIPYLFLRLRFWPFLTTVRARYCFKIWFMLSLSHCSNVCILDRVITALDCISFVFVHEKIFMETPNCVPLTHCVENLRKWPVMRETIRRDFIILARLVIGIYAHMASQVRGCIWSYSKGPGQSNLDESGGLLYTSVPCSCVSDVEAYVLNSRFVRMQLFQIRVTIC